MPMNERDLNYIATKEKKRSKTLKRIAITLSVLLIIGIALVIYLWNLPHKKVENVKGLSVTAVVLAKEYTANEQQANAKYLNKAIAVSGVVSEIDKNQDGGTMVILQSDDPMTGVQCSMRDKSVSVTKGQQISIKGFCSGNGITGVSLTDCVME